MDGKNDNTDKDLIICRCEEVTESEIKQAIKSGARTITGIKRRTRACMGLCQGRTCQILVRRLLAKEINQKPSELKPFTTRPPVRAIKLGILGENRE